MAKNVLIAALGESPIVVTSMVQALQAKKDLTIDQLHVIHPQGEKLIDLGYDLLKEHLNGKCIVTQSILPFPDVNSRDTSIKFLRVLSGSIQTHEEAGNSVYLSLAGGRKNMSALMAATCQFFKCVRGLYHVLDKNEDDPKKRNFHSIEALFDFSEGIRGEKLSPPAEELILVDIPYEQLPSGVKLRQYLDETQSNPNVSSSIEIDDELEAFGREIFHEEEKTEVLDLYLSEEAYKFYQNNRGETTQRLMSYFRSMRNPQVLCVHKHDFKGDKTKTDCICFKKYQTQLRPFYYQTNSQIVVATITGHGSEAEYKRIINGEKQLYSANHPPHIHLSKLENSVLIAPIGKTPMVVTQTFVLLSAIEGADIEKVIVIYPKNSEISNGVNLIKKAFKKFKKKCAITSEEIENIGDVASSDDCKVYLEKLTTVITKARADNPHKNIHLSLSGGRKGMAALTLFAAQQANIDAVYHTLITDIDLEKKIEKETTLLELNRLTRSEQAQRLFLDDYDKSKFELVRVPVIPASIETVETS